MLGDCDIDVVESWTFSQSIESINQLLHRIEMPQATTLSTRPFNLQQTRTWYNSACSRLGGFYHTEDTPLSCCESYNPSFEAGNISLSRTAPASR